MSHFSVLVIGRGVDEQLEPYDENKEVAPYKRKCWCINLNASTDARKRVEREYKSIDILREEFKNEKDQSDKNWKKFIKHYQDLSKKYTEQHPLYNKPDPKCKSCKGTGKETTRYNKDSKWDWYQIGGRWAGMLLLKKNAKTGSRGDKSSLMENDPYSNNGFDSAQKKDIDFKAMENNSKDKEYYSKNWDEIMSGKGFYKPEYYIERYGTKENYIKSVMKFTTFAVVRDGEWFEKGRMGWWGMSSETPEEEKKWEEGFFKEFIEPLPDNTRLTIVDCHI